MLRKGFLMNNRRRQPKGMLWSILTLNSLPQAIQQIYEGLLQPASSEGEQQIKYTLPLYAFSIFSRSLPFISNSP
jgi:hypothetical protein